MQRMQQSESRAQTCLYYAEPQKKSPYDTRNFFKILVGIKNIILIFADGLTRNETLQQHIDTRHPTLDATLEGQLGAVVRALQQSPQSPTLRPLRASMLRAFHCRRPAPFGERRHPSNNDVTYLFITI